MIGRTRNARLPDGQVEAFDDGSGMWLAIFELIVGSRQHTLVGNELAMTGGDGREESELVAGPCLCTTH